jgi:hypothetical protein
MGLSSDLVSQFVKITKDDTKTKTETTVYGTAIVESDGSMYVKFDNSEQKTPVSKTTTVKNGDRVLVRIKNHTATIIGNTTSPSVNEDYVDLEKAKIDNLVAENATIKGRLSASELDIGNLKSNKASVTDLDAAVARISTLEAGKIDAEYVQATYATIKELEATDAEIHKLQATHTDFVKTTTDELSAVNADIEDLNANKLDAESAKVTYANIDFSNIGLAAIERFFTKSGMIANLVAADGTITGELVGVTISGDLIEGNTIKADKLVVKGSDGLYYKLNIEAGATTSEKVTESDLQNGLHGTAIIAKTITAEKVSVNDLVAFGADIAGFHITDQNTFYSGVKSSVNNTTQGIYMDATGQMNVGDGSNFFKYYKAADGSYKLEISADSILLGSSKKSVETAINDVQKSVDGITIGAENLYVQSASFDSDAWINTAGWVKDGTDSNGNARIKHGTWAGLYQFIKVKAGDVCTLSANILGDGVADFRFYGSLYSEPSVSSTVILGVTPAHSDRGIAPLEEQRFHQTFAISEDGYLRVRIENGVSNSYIWISSMKLERGNRSTDWSPAPEDMATSEEVDKAQSTANEADTKAAAAQALIAQLADSISMLVTDGNGTSLMTQTENGWTFSTANIQGLVNNISDNLNTLTENVGGVSGTVDMLKQAVVDLEETAEYVKITTYEDEPCIELGEADSDFKLRITNTRMMFTEGSTVLAYFTNQAFNSKKVVIEEELQQGGFVWKVRSNGNLGLTWKGGNS